MTEAGLARAARALAIGIALLAAIDPAVERSRAGRLVIAIVASSDSAAVDRVEAELRNDFTVVRGALPGADATVAVDDPPADDISLGEPLFIVIPDAAVRGVDVVEVDAPERSAVAATASVRVRLRVRGASRVTVSLVAAGVEVDRVERADPPRDSVFDAVLSFVPPAPGIFHLRAYASLGDAERAPIADVRLEAIDRRWSVLVVDARPSWQSTFVRRALETDTRFVVSSRVGASRGVELAAGQPPRALDDAAVLDGYDAVVIGAPEALSARDVAGVESYLRRRGGTVVFLLDQREPGPVDRLLAVTRWRSTSAGDLVELRDPLTPTDTGTPRITASELAWPDPLPSGASAVLVTQAPSGAAAGAVAGAVPAGAPIVWTAPVGAGRVVVSGALDSWRFRADSASGFERRWRSIVADGAAAALPPVVVRLPLPVASPGERVPVRALVRSASLAGPGRSAPTVVAASIVGAGDDTGHVVRLWPDAEAGLLAGELRAPSRPGTYRLVVKADGEQGSASLVVADRAATSTVADRGLMGTIARSSGGDTLTMSELSRLPRLIRSATRPVARPERWRPMRSPWWLALFTAALGYEWWWRRRRSLP